MGQGTAGLNCMKIGKKIKRTISVLLCIAIVFLFCGCRITNRLAMKKTIAYACGNSELLRSCAQELQTIIPAETGQKRQSYKIEQLKGSALLLFDYVEESNTSMHSDLCEEVFGGGLVKFILVNYSDAVCSVEFVCAGYGFGPNTGYCEIQYVSSDVPNDLFFFDDNMSYTEQDGGYFGCEKYGDNTFFYYRIAECLYYTEATF